MGQPNGHKADSLLGGLAAGMTALEWDYRNDIFLATFTNGKATNLQAYAGAIGPAGATDISCPAFRNSA